MHRATAAPAAAPAVEGPNRLPPPTPARSGERGSASVEAAIAVCGLIAILAMVLGGVAVMIAQLRCIDAAREAARLVARGEPERAEQAARQVAPGRARVDIRVDADQVIVQVTAEPIGGALTSITVRGEAAAVLEPGLEPGLVPGLEPGPDPGLEGGLEPGAKPGLHAAPEPRIERVPEHGPATGPGPGPALEPGMVRAR